MKNLSLRPNLAITVITLGCTAITCPVIAGTITFDEFPADNTNGPLPASRYSSLGVTFVATDDGSTWGGLSNGDPGNWDINGTNGPIFSGFNGDSYGLTMLFANEVSAFSLDASRSNGSQAGNSLTLKGYNNGSLVESVTVTFNDINQWSTLSLLTNVDEVRWIGNGIGFHPFGVDNIRWNGAVQTVPEPTSTLSLLVLGTLGAASTLKHKLKPSKSTEKGTIKVG